MILEVDSAANYICFLIEEKNNQLSEKVQRDFRLYLGDSIALAFSNHWHSSHPSWGASQRCIRINSDNNDVLIKRAESRSGLQEGTVNRMIQDQVTLWINPGEVLVKHCELGQYITIFHKEYNARQPWTPQKKNKEERTRHHPMDYFNTDKFTSVEELVAYYVSH